jgi:hypothetical protein
MAKHRAYDVLKYPKPHTAMLIPVLFYVVVYCGIGSWMKNDEDKLPVPHDIWSRPGRTLTAKKDIGLILASVKNLPVIYWRPFFFFTGAKDADFISLTTGEFPVTTLPGKTHPVIALKPLPDGAGYRVNPCSSQRPRHCNTLYFIKKGCRLAHTGHEMDRNSFVIAHIEVPLPASIASTLRFRGEVPVACIETLEF